MIAALPQNLEELKSLPDDHCRTILEFYDLPVTPYADFALQNCVGVSVKVISPFLLKVPSIFLSSTRICSLELYLT